MTIAESRIKKQGRLKALFCLRRKQLVNGFWHHLCGLLLLSLAVTEVPVFGAEAPAAELVARFSEIGSIVFDVRDSRGGNGDVASAYLMATDMLERFQYKGKILFIVDSESLEVLSKLNGRTLKPGQKIYQSKIQLIEDWRLIKDEIPISLLIQLALPEGILNNPKSLRSMNLAKNGIVVGQTVFGGSEMYQGSGRTGILQTGSNIVRWNSAGIGPSESGYYYDSVAATYAQVPKEHRRDFLISQIAQTPHANQYRRVTDVLNGWRLKGSTLSTVYGIWQDSQQEHFASYLDGLVEEMEKYPSKSFTFFSPLDLDLANLTKSTARHTQIIEQTSQMPEEAVPGKIYLVRTEALPHSIFVGLLASSEIPPVVAGDGAVSAMLTLGEPFLMTKVDWNSINLMHVRRALLARITDRNLKSVVRAIFPANSDLQTDPNLRRGLELLEPQAKQAFKDYAGSIPTLNATLIQNVVAMRQLSTSVPDELLAGLEPLVIAHNTKREMIQTFSRSRFEVWLLRNNREALATLFPTSGFSEEANPGFKLSRQFESAIRGLVRATLATNIHTQGPAIVSRRLEQIVTRNDLSIDELLKSVNRAFKPLDGWEIIHKSSAYWDPDAITIAAAIRRWDELSSANQMFVSQFITKKQSEFFFKQVVAIAAQDAPRAKLLKLLIQLDQDPSRPLLTAFLLHHKRSLSFSVISSIVRIINWLELPKHATESAFFKQILAQYRVAPRGSDLRRNLKFLHSLANPDFSDFSWSERLTLGPIHAKLKSLDFCDRLLLDR